MIISRDTGMINEYFSILKGQLIDLSYFSTIGKMENDQEETFAVKMKDGEIVYLTEAEIKKKKLKKIPIHELPESCMTDNAYRVKQTV